MSIDVRIWVSNLSDCIQRIIWIHLKETMRINQQMLQICKKWSEFRLRRLREKLWRHVGIWVWTGHVDARIECQKTIRECVPCTWYVDICRICIYTQLQTRIVDQRNIKKLSEYVIQYDRISISPFVYLLIVAVVYLPIDQSSIHIHPHPSIHPSVRPSIHLFTVSVYCIYSIHLSMSDYTHQKLSDDMSETRR